MVEAPAAPSGPDVREAIIETGLELGTQYGEEALTMRGIAAKLGISPTTLYQHFDSKAAILQEIRVRGLRQLTTHTLAGFELDDPREALLEISRGYVAFAREHPWLYKLLIESDDLPVEVLNEAQQVLIRADLQGIRAHALQRFRAMAGADPQVVNAFMVQWWCGLHGVSSLFVHGRLRPGHAVVPVDDVDATVDGYIVRMVDALLALGSPGA
jgi:AcrR family transcriptional regulator